MRVLGGMILQLIGQHEDRDRRRRETRRERRRRAQLKRIRRCAKR
ncbi:MAG TPA: hypothetical protein VNE62_11350 [Actinomycetota bacterium]|nr:hypothetical protein [Actinomycetota bacterium]